MGIIGWSQYIGHWFYFFVYFGFLSKVPFNSCDHVETVSWPNHSQIRFKSYTYFHLWLTAALLKSLAGEEMPQKIFDDNFSRKYGSGRVGIEITTPWLAIRLATDSFWVRFERNEGPKCSNYLIVLFYCQIPIVHDLHNLKFSSWDPSLTFYTNFQLFSDWLIMNVFFVVVLYCFCGLFFQKQLFRKILPGNHYCQTVWIQIRPEPMLGLNLVQAVCKGYQQTTLVGKI